MEVKEMELRQGLSIQEKLRILADAAKYDVACTSSGVDRKGMNANTVQTGYRTIQSVLHLHPGNCVS